MMRWVLAEESTKAKVRVMALSMSMMVLASPKRTLVRMGTSNGCKIAGCADMKDGET